MGFNSVFKGLNSSSVGMARMIQETIFDFQYGQKVLCPTLRPGRVRDNLISLSKPSAGGRGIFHWFFRGKCPPLSSRDTHLTTYIDVVHKEGMHVTSPYLF